MREVVLVNISRTPLCVIGGALKDKTAAQLGILALNNAVEKFGIAKEDVNTIFASSANHDLNAVNLGRYITLGGEFPMPTSSVTVEMLEGSTLAAMNHAASKIALGLDDVCLVGGMDSWSQKPAFMGTDIVPYKLIPPQMLVQKNSPFEDEEMDHVEVSDRIAKLYCVSREECDEVAAKSREDHAKAVADGIIGNEIVPYVVPATRKTPEITVATDDVFSGNAQEYAPLLGGVCTMGNVAHMTEGAGYVLMMSAEKAKSMGLKPLARWVGGADVGCEPNVTGVAAAYSNLKALKYAGLSIKDIAVWENNQLTAAYDICTRKEMARQAYTSMKNANWNGLGGALAVGNSGSVAGIWLAKAAISEMEDAGQYAVLSSCCGGGVGVSTILEKL
ncbi:MAG: thiolase family protein [Oscillibacter sp.]|nr:thiolase family protein [Oscillibacter sp.]